MDYKGKTPRKAWGPKIMRGPKKDRYQIVIEHTDGSRRTVTKPSPEEADRLKAEIDFDIEEATVAEREGRDYPEWDGTLQWVEGLVAKMTLEVYINPMDQDLRAALKAVASAATSIKNLHDTTDLEERLGQAEDVLKEILSARKHGTGTQGTTEER